MLSPLTADFAIEQERKNTPPAVTDADRDAARERARLGGRS